MADFLLIHGSCHGAWCWRDVIPALAALGHDARAIDLPGNGADTTPHDRVTLADSAAAVLAASTPETVVVGHSWGGFPISAAAEADPEGMRALIYLCAYIPVQSGLSMVDVRKRAPRHPILPAVRRSADGLSMTVDPALATGIFYNDCAPDVADRAVAQLCAQALPPQTTPLTVTERFASVPKSYIVCRDDHCIPPEYQDEMTADWPRDRVHEMATGHSPFLSDPQGLAALLSRIAEAG
ncbi:alpha/beta fold hydrolase [Seohaeicola nanhaiensis]|uniref:Alpha/beta fold hydrolase n=1 Tax=Seohaeicola nanhaiensis TaxID=1387282 RepID=A0ABV9KPK6_9RHOB